MWDFDTWQLDYIHYKWFCQYQLFNCETLYHSLEYQVTHCHLVTNAGPLGVLDVEDTWLHLQKLCHQVNTLSVH